MWNGADPCGMMQIRAEWCGSVRNGADPCGMVRTGVESVLVCAESAESAQSVRIRAEHQGEGKLLVKSINPQVLQHGLHILQKPLGLHTAHANCII